MTLKKSLLALAAVAGLCLTGATQASAIPTDSGSNRIIGGTLVPKGSYPWMVKVEVRKDMFIADCNGTLISRDLALTSGGCFSSMEMDGPIAIDPSDPDVRVDVIHGAVDYMEGTVQVSKEWKTPLAQGEDPEEKRTRNNGYSNDWALIKLPTPVDLPSYPQLSGSAALDARAMYLSMGWGLTKDLHANPGTPITTLLNEYQLPAWANGVKDCLGYAYEICAGYADHSKYNGAGDAGAPLFALPSETPGRFVQIGIALTENEQPQLRAQRYSRISHYLPEIKKLAEELKGTMFTVAQ